MQLELMVQSGEQPYDGELGPDIFDENVTVVKMLIGTEHMKKIQSLKPNTKLRVTLRGMVQSFEQKAQGSEPGTVGELCIYATELDLSRGSEFDALLEGDE